MDKVKLFNAWPSPFCYRVIWALEMKGIEYECIDEDLRNKSPLLLQYNPLHKKVPVLLHNGKPICESLVILEYIEETWPHHHPLLPNDPCERSMARFWVKFIEEKGLTIWILFRTIGEEQEKARNETLVMLRTIEDHALGNKKFLGGEKIGMVDILFGAVFHWLKVIQDIVQVKLLEANTFPALFRWFNDFKEVDIIKNNLPHHHQMFVIFKKIRENILATSS